MVDSLSSSLVEEASSVVSLLVSIGCVSEIILLLNETIFTETIDAIDNDSFTSCFDMRYQLD